MKRLILSTATILAVVGMAVIPVHAETAQITLSQQIQDPIAKLLFVDSSNNPIAQPSIAFPMRTASFKCQTANNGAPVATLGTPQQKLFISVPDRVSNGWDVSLAPTNGTSVGWSSDNGRSLSINDDTDSGCGRHVGNNGYGGLMTVHTDEATVAGTCSTGCSDAFTSPQIGQTTSFGQTEAASLYSSTLEHVGWEGTLQNIKLEQTIPAGVPAGNYQLPMTITLTEL